jgi:hypothetical protein
MLAPYMPRKMSRETALARGEPYYFMGDECPHGHIAQRRVSNYRCRECETISSSLAPNSAAGKAFRARQKALGECPGGVDHERPKDDRVYCDPCLDRKSLHPGVRKVLTDYGGMSRRDYLHSLGRCVIGGDKHPVPRGENRICDDCRARWNKTEKRRKRKATAA